MSLTSLGDGLALSVVPLAALQYLDGAATISLVVGSGWIAAAAVSLIGGASVDSLGVARTIRWSQAVRTLSLASLLPFLWLDLPWVLAVLTTVHVLNSMCEWLTDTSVEAAIAKLEDDRRFAREFGRTRSVQQMFNRLVGPATGGALFAVDPRLGLAACIAAYGLSLITLPDIQQFKEQGRLTIRRSELQRLISEPLFRSSALVAGSISLGVGVTLGPYVLFVQEELELRDEFYGLLIAVGSVGGIVGGVTAGPWLTAELRRGRVIIAWLLAGGFQLLFGTAQTVWIAAVGSIGFAVVATWVGVAVSAARQRVASHEIRGTVAGVGRAISAAGLALGAVLATPLVAIAGVRSAWLVAAALHLAAALFLVVGRYSWPARTNELVD